MTPRAQLACFAAAVGLFLGAVWLLFLTRDVVIDDVRFECASVLGSGGGAGYTEVADEGDDAVDVPTETDASLEEARADRLEQLEQAREERLAQANDQASGTCDRKRTTHAAVIGPLAFPSGVLWTLVLARPRRVEESASRVK